MRTTWITLMLFALTGLANAQGVSPAEDEARIEELIRLRAASVEAAASAVEPVQQTLPEPVADLPEIPAGIQIGPIQFDQLAAVKGRWIAVQMSNGRTRQGRLVDVKGGDVIVRIGNGAQGATLPLSRKNIRSLELLQ